jgi:hypothetical protein
MLSESRGSWWAFWPDCQEAEGEAPSAWGFMRGNSLGPGMVPLSGPNSHKQRVCLSSSSLYRAPGNLPLGSAGA